MEKQRSYDPTKHKHKNFVYRCKYRYDDDRPNRGMTRLGRLGKEIPGRLRSGGAKALIGRCILINHGNRRCLYEDKDHLSCPISIHPKSKRQSL
jgi:hypothetical protein